MAGKRTLYCGETGTTPLGRLWLAVTENGLAAVEWGKTDLEFEAMIAKRYKYSVRFEPFRVKQAVKELGEYLRGKRQAFSISIDWSLLRPFQRAALQETMTIPYGETRSYKQIAERIGRPRAARAVGRAEATNPMPLVIPCHRVIGSDGKLHGYGLGEGLPTKEWLLKLEGAVIV